MEVFKVTIKENEIVCPCEVHKMIFLMNNFSKNSPLTFLSIGGQCAVPPPHLFFALPHTKYAAQTSVQLVWQHLPIY